MPTPIEQQICEAVQTRMRLIKTANGYVHNFTDDRVELWATNWQASEGNAISILTGDTNSEDAPNQRRKTQHSLSLRIEGYLKTATFVDAQKLIADIKKAIRGGGETTIPPWLDERWPAVKGTKPGLAIHTEEAGHSVLKKADDFEITGVQVRLTVTYLTQKFNGYDQ